MRGFKSIHVGKMGPYISVTDSLIVWDLAVKSAPTSWCMSYIYIYIYIYIHMYIIYMCVCVCIHVCDKAHITFFMMTSSHGNIFHVIGHLSGEFTGSRWIPRTKASDAELLVFSLICTRINGWVNNGEASDLRRHRAHYDVTVMSRRFRMILSAKLYIDKKCLILLNTLRSRQNTAILQTHFQMHFLQWKCMNVASDFPEICS